MKFSTAFRKLISNIFLVFVVCISSTNLLASNEYDHSFVVSGFIRKIGIDFYYMKDINRLINAVSAPLSVENLVTDTSKIMKNMNKSSEKKYNELVELHKKFSVDPGFKPFWKSELNNYQKLSHIIINLIFLECIEDQIEDRIEVRIEDELNIHFRTNTYTFIEKTSKEKIWNQIWKQFGSQVSDKDRDKIWFEIWETISPRVNSCANTEAWSQIDRYVENHVQNFLFKTKQSGKKLIPELENDLKKLFAYSLSLYQMSSIPLRSSYKIVELRDHLAKYIQTKLEVHNIDSILKSIVVPEVSSHIMAIEFELIKSMLIN